MKKRNTFFFSSSSRKALKQKNKHKAKQKSRSVSGVSISEDEGLLSSGNEGKEEGTKDKFEEKNNENERHVDGKRFVPYKRLDFKQKVDLDNLRQQSVSPFQSVAATELQRDLAEKNAFANMLSPTIDGPEAFDENNQGAARTEQLDLIRASSRNPTATLELDLDCNVKYLSKSWETFVGTRVKKIIKQPISKIIIGDDNDKDVFKRATEIMSEDDASYRVRFIVAKNNLRLDLPFSDSEDENGSNRSNNTVGGGSIKSDTASAKSDASIRSGSSTKSIPSTKSGSSTSQEAEEDIADITIENVNVSPSTLSIESKGYSDLSTTDEYIELEGQGILIHDIQSNKPTYSMWLLRPYIERQFLIELPTALTEILGFGAELFANYLKAISDAGISDESSVPTPTHVLCNICEQQVPSWWLERHSEICYFESKAESDLQIAHDNLLEQKMIITSIASSNISEYKGLRLPISPENPPYKNLTMTNRSLSNALRFPYRTLHSLVELCDQSLGIDPMDFDSDEEKTANEAKYKSVEKEFGDVFEWHIPKSNDRAINVLIEDTELLAKEKAEAVLRVVNTLRYHNQLKKEVDKLVLETVHNTVEKVNEHLQGINNVSSPIVAAASTGSPDLLYSYMNKDIVESEPGSRAPSVSSPLRRNDSAVSMQRQTSASSIVSDRRSYYNVESEQLTDSFKDLSLLDPCKNNSVGSFKKPTHTTSMAIHTSPRRPYSPSPVINSPLTSIQRNNKSQSNLYLHSNDSSLLPNTTSSSPLLVGNEGSNVFLDCPRKDPDDIHHNSAPTNLVLPQHNTISKPPLSPLLISSFQGSKPAAPSIKDYEILKPISKGAFGSVYLARKKVNGEYFAIKVLKKSDMVAKNQVTNVKAERAIMMAQSDSPFVAKLFCTFQTRNYLFLVMEYLNGGDCASLLKVLGTLPESWTKRYVAEIVVGVDDLHQKGIVHRDLKPDNFLIDPRGHLKLTDFGLSRMGLVGRQFRHQKGGNSSLVNTPDAESFPFLGSSAVKKQSPIIPMMMEHKRSISYASSISSSDSSGNFINSSNNSNYNVSNNNNTYNLSSSNNNNHNMSNNSINTESRSSGNNFNSPTTAWFENLMRQEKSNSGLTGSPRSSSLATATNSISNSVDVTTSPVVKPLHRSNSQTSFALVDDEISLNNQAPNLALFNPLSSAEERKFVGTPDYLAPETISGSGQDESSDWWSLGCILFEFLFGYPPFHASTINQVFENILSGKIDWPADTEEELLQICSPESRNLITKLLDVDPRKRLGSNGAHEIKCHPFFHGIEWDKLWDEEASFIPSVDDPENTDYFDSRGADMNEDIYDKDENALDGDADTSLQELVKSEDSGATYQNAFYDWLNKNTGESTLEEGDSKITTTLVPHPGGSESQHLQSPSVVKKERRKSTRLNESSSEFGSFQYRNLTALEKANKDVINRLKSEHMDHKNSISSSSSSIDSGTRSRGLSFSSSYTNSPFSGKPPLSAGANAMSPSRPVPQPVHSHSFSTHNTSPFMKHERLSSSIHSSHSAGVDDAVLGSRDSSGRASPIGNLHQNLKTNTVADCSSASTPTSEFAVPTINPKSISKLASPMPLGPHTPIIKPINKGIYGKNLVDFSPSSSDNEESRNSAILRIKRRRSRRLGSGNSNSSFGRTGSNSSILTKTSSGTAENEDPKERSLDILLCEPIPIFRFSEKKLFEKLGCNVVAVGSGDEIVRRVSGQVKFDLIFTTIKVQKLHLNDIIKLIRYTNTINSGTPIIALTSFYKEAQALKIFDGIVEKPATISKIEPILAKYRSKKEELTSDAESVLSSKKIEQ